MNVLYLIPSQQVQFQAGFFFPPNPYLPNLSLIATKLKTSKGAASYSGNKKKVCKYVIYLFSIYFHSDI